MSKKPKYFPAQHGKTTNKRIIESPSNSSIHKTPIWRFDKLDKDGKFRFDLSRSEINWKEILQKLIDYGNMEWAQIDNQTHDKTNKTKHHFLDYKGMSKDAKDRIEKLHLQENTDIIYSLALKNKLRLIGLREHGEFHIIWIDPNHEFYPCSK